MVSIRQLGAVLMGEKGNNFAVSLFLITERKFLFCHKGETVSTKKTIKFPVNLLPRRSHVVSTLIYTAHCVRPPSSNCSCKSRRHSVNLRRRPSIFHVWSLCLIVIFQEPMCSTFFFILTRSACKINTISISSTYTDIKAPSEGRISWILMKAAEHLANRQGRLL